MIQMPPILLSDRWRCRRRGGRLLVLAARDRDRRLGLGAGAFHVEPAEAHLDAVAAQQPHPVDAAGGTGQHVGLRDGEDDGAGAGDQLEKFRLRLAAVRLDVKLVGEVGAAAAERKLPGLRVGQIDGLAGGDADLDAVDLALELLGDILAAVGARRRRAGYRERRAPPAIPRPMWSICGSPFSCKCPFTPLKPRRPISCRGRGRKSIGTVDQNP